MNKLRVVDVAKLMGVSAQVVRIAMQKGVLDIGTVNLKGGRYTYYISKKKFQEATGIKI